MIPPNFQRGVPISADQLNMLIEEVRSNSIKDGTGYTVTKTPYGTSLRINQGIATGGGGNAEFATCPFKVTDASTSTGGVPALKVSVQNTPVQTPSGIRWPDGMGLGGPPFILEIAKTSYIYCKMQYVANDVVLDTNTDAITVLQSEDILPNEINAEYVLLATVEVSGTGNDQKILQITNVCAAVSPNPCNLAWQ
jgi:hypothetical protein